jgi:hypothetical protein
MAQSTNGAKSLGHHVVATHYGGQHLKRQFFPYHHHPHRLHGHGLNSNLTSAPPSNGGTMSLFLTEFSNLVQAHHSKKHAISYRPSQTATFPVLTTASQQMNMAHATPFNTTSKTPHMHLNSTSEG